MLDFEGDVENTFLCSFVISNTDVFGNVLTYELMENGKDLPVTNENRKVIWKYCTAEHVSYCRLCPFFESFVNVTVGDLYICKLGPFRALRNEPSSIVSSS